MKKLIITLLFTIGIISSYSQFQWGNIPLHDSLYLEDADTLTQINLVLPDKPFTYAYVVKYGSIDSTTLNIYFQASIPSYGWITISDTIIIDSNTVNTPLYITGSNPPYPEMKLMIKRDTIDESEDGWIRDAMYIRKID